MKILYSKKIKLILLFSILTALIQGSFSNLNAEKKTAEEVFDRLIDIQYVVPSVDITNMRNILNNNAILSLKNRYKVNLSYLKTLSRLFDLETNKSLEKVFDSELIDDADLKNYIYELFDLLQNDIPKLIQNLKENDFCKGAANSEEEKITTDLLMQKYQNLLTTILGQPDQYQMAKYILAVGENLFRYCYCDPTFDDYKNMFLDENYHSIIKFLHTHNWFTLISLGWKWWNKDCIKSIKSQTDRGAELVYIAGGCDIYYPIKEGIYNIRVIDPILPSQVRYYSTSWEWLVDGSVGDEIEFVFADKQISLKRVKQEQTGRMWPKLSTTGETVEVPESVTVWEVYGDPYYLKKSFSRTKTQKTNNVYRSPGIQKRAEKVRAFRAKKEKEEYRTRKAQGIKSLLGKVIFERRFVTQNDYKSDPKKVFLMSTTEMISSIDIPDHKGWGIDSYKLDDNFMMHVKQLKAPISSKVLQNIRFACENSNNLKYIMLTSDPT